MRPTSAEASVFAFRIRRRALDSPRWEPAPQLLVHVDDGGSAVPEHLSWVSEDGAECAVAFPPDMASCYGHHRAADGGLVEVRGELDGRWVFPEGTEGACGYEFDTEVEVGDGWHQSGRLRLLVDDGGEAPVRWAAWRDRAGNAGSVALRSASPSGNADVTDMVTAVRASAEHRDAGEVAANLVAGSSSKWLAFHNYASLEFDLTRPVAATSYVLTSADDAPDRDPAAWTLRGSLDGHLWRNLDSRTHQSFAHRHQSRTYRIAEPGSYGRYRIDITGSNGSPHLQLANVRFLAGGSGGFVGYRQRAGEGPVGYRGVPDARDSPNPPMLPWTDEPLVLRIGFADQQAWEAVREAVRLADGEDTFEYMTFLDDPDYRDLPTEQILALVPEDYPHSFLVMADDTTFTSADRPLLVVDLDEERGREFRTVPVEVFSISANLSIANMDFYEFADAVDSDGVFRGF